MTTLLASQFKSRSALEAHVRNAYDLTPAHKKDVEIVGTKEELATLGLSSKTVFWGISCRDSDEITFQVKVARTETEETHELIDRGERHASGINGNLSK